VDDNGTWRCLAALRPLSPMTVISGFWANREATGIL
jgi:hypothetical protein